MDSVGNHTRRMNTQFNPLEDTCENILCVDGISAMLTETSRFFYQSPSGVMEPLHYL